jgi:hypothetical protein
MVDLLRQSTGARYWSRTAEGGLTTHPFTNSLRRPATSGGIQVGRKFLNKPAQLQWLQNAFDPGQWATPPAVIVRIRSK